MADTSQFCHKKPLPGSLLDLQASKCKILTRFGRQIKLMLSR